MTNDRNTIDAKLHADDLPQYLKDFLSKYDADLKRLTVDSLQLWSSNPEQLRGLMSNLGADESVPVQVLLLSAMINPLMQHLCTILYLTTMGNKDVMRKAIVELSEHSIGNIKMDFLEMARRFEREGGNVFH